MRSRAQLLPHVEQSRERETVQRDERPFPPRHLRASFGADGERPEQADRVADPPRHVNVERPPAGKERFPLPADAEDAPEPAPEPQDLRHLLELPVQRQLGEQQAVGHEHVAVHADPLEHPGAKQPVDHVARRHLHHPEAQPLPAAGDAERVEAPRLARQNLAGRADAPVQRVRQHDLGMAIQRSDELLQPARMPEVVVAGKREILGVRVALAREGERPSRVVHQPETLRVRGVGDT